MSQEHLILANQLLQQEKFLEALSEFTVIVQQHPTLVAGLTGQAVCFANLGRWMEALNAAINAAGYSGYQHQEMELFIRIVEASKLISYLEPVESMLKISLGSFWLEVRSSRLLLQQVLAKYGKPLAEADVSGEWLLSLALDESVCKLLERTCMTSYSLEKALLSARFRLLDNAVNGVALDVYMPFLSAMACQRLLNDGLYATAPEEVLLLTKLAASAAGETVTGLMLQLCYASFEEAMGLWLDHGTQIEVSGFANIVTDLRFYSDVFAHTDRGSVSDETSLTVQSFYMNSPYPKWKQLLLNPVTLEQIFLMLGKKPKSRTRALVAGCGTGRQVVELALTNPNARITAIDISPVSLAFAKGMAKKYGVENVEFHLLDILDIAQLQQTYDYIMCSGVLHHMASPSAGLGALEGVLRLDGVVLLGLYSKLARTELAGYKAEILRYLGVDEAGVTPEGVARWRAQLTDVQRQRSWLNSEDFFYLNGLMDLLFHPQQTEYTLLEVEQLLHSQGIEFKQMAVSSQKQQLYKDALKAVYQEDVDKTSIHKDNSEQLICWHAFEVAHPKFFGGMYNFFASRR